MTDYLVSISSGFIAGMVAGGVSVALGIIRRSFRQVLNVAD